MKRIAPVDLNAQATFARAGSATWWDESGTLQTAGSNVLRFTWDRETHDYRGALVEAAATNLILNNTTMSTQTRTVTNATTYTLSFYGTGSITLSGAATGTVIGTGSTARKTYMLSTNSSSLTLTVSGAVNYGQLEIGVNASSVIVTAGSAVTRAADVITGHGVVYSDFTDATPAYNAGTTYAAADAVQYGLRTYESLQASNTGHTPDSEPTWWLDTGATNPFKLFDGAVSKKAVAPGSAAITVVKAPSNVNAVAAIGAQDTLSIHLLYGNGNTDVYSAYSDGEPEVTYLAEGNGTIITLVASNAVDGGPPLPDHPAVGELVAGTLQTIGETQYGVEIALIDYSKKEADEFGDVVFVERAYSLRMTANVMVEKADFNASLRSLLDARASPGVWVASDDQDYDVGAVIYGFLRDMRAVIAYPTASLYSLEIEGLT